MVCALPESWALALGRFFGWLWYYVLPIRRGVAFHNVDRVFGRELSRAERRRVVRACLTHLALYAIDVLRAPRLTAEDSARRIERQGFEHVERALAAGKGCICVSVHIDSLDLATMSQTIRGLPIVGVAKKIHWGAANDFVQLVRRRTGIDLLDTGGVREQIKQALHDNKVVALAIDQHMPSYRGIVCEFFGALASTTPAPARFAFECGCPIVPVVMIRRGFTGDHVIRFEAPLVLEEPHTDREANIRHNTERLNRVAERWIREAPDQWLWLHKRWKVQDAPEGWDIPENLRHLLRSTDRTKCDRTVVLPP